MMDTLPVELIRLIYSYCDPASVRGLRLLTPTIANVGYEYLLSSNFSVSPWRDDVARLRSISRHNRLRPSLESVSFNLTEIHAENARQTSAYPACSKDSEQSAQLLAETWRLFSEFEQRRAATTPLHAQDPAEVAAVFRSLPSLSSVDVTFRQTPYDLDLLREAVKVPANTTMTRSEAIKSLNVLVLALQHASVPPVLVPFGPVPPSTRYNSRSSRSGPFSSVHTSPISPSAPVSAAPSAAPSVASTRTSSPVSSAVSSPAPSSPGSPTLPAEEDGGSRGFELSRCRIKSFAIDRLPFELFRFPSDRRTWFQCRDLFAGLTRLDLTIDTSEVIFPQAKMKAINGLAYIIRKASQLTHLSLAFHNYASPRDFFHLPLQELLGESGSLEGPPLVGNGSNGFSVGSNVFRFNALTDFALNGVTCEEGELRGFLLRHAPTLERLRLGGRGLARGSFDTSMGGIRISHGTVWSLLRSLRGRLPQLERMHFEGIFYCETETLAAVPENMSGAAAASTGVVALPDDDATLNTDHHHLSRLRYESYLFRATTDDDWTPASDERKGPMTPRTITSEAFEAYLLGQVAEYPGFFKRVGAP